MTGRRLAAAVVTVTVCLVLAACTGGEDEPADPSPTTATTVTTLAPDGTIRLGVPTEPASLDPFDSRSRTPAGLAILGVVLPQLFAVDPDGEVVGVAVEAGSVREAADGRTASFRLEKDAVWSDGQPISVDDVRFTLETVRGDAWPGPRAGYDRITAVGGEGRTVRFSFDPPLPGWRRLFSGDDFLLPSHRLAGRDLEREWQGGPDLAGGPFRLGPVTRGLEVVLSRNEAWWGKGPRVGAVRVLVVPDVRTMEQLLERGELDVAWPSATTNRIGRFRRLGDVAMSVAEPGGRLALLVANTEALSAERRRALLGLPDRDRFAAVFLEGEAAPAATLVPPVEADGSEGPWRAVVPDSSAGGIGAAFEGTFVAAEELPMASLMGRLLESGVRGRGGELELKYAESTVVDASWLPDGEFDLAMVERVAWPAPCWRCWFGEEAGGRGNLTRISGLDDLATAADGGDAAAAGDLQESLRSRGVLLPLWRPRAVLVGRGVQGLEANSWSTGPFWGVERWAPAG
ncbi:MAG: ABC transporter substrate-binding protein [Acidimicrobiia bacterium]